jgi:hypothetical protein
MLVVGHRHQKRPGKRVHFQVCEVKRVRDLPNELLTGTYFDFAVNGSKTILLSLHNGPPTVTSTPASLTGKIFMPTTNPISLLARVDDDEYHILPNASLTVPIRTGNLDAFIRHDIRIIAPMIRGCTVETLEVEGLWIDEAGQLLPFEAENDSDNQISDSSLEEYAYEPQSFKSSHRKMLEIITDLPGSASSKGGTGEKTASQRILGGVLGWEYLLGEMFGSDHVTIGMDVRVSTNRLSTCQDCASFKLFFTDSSIIKGMCLIQDCIGGKGTPAGLADVFFQRFRLYNLAYEHRLTHI